MFCRFHPTCPPQSTEGGQNVMTYRDALHLLRLDESSNALANSVGLQVFGFAYCPVQQDLADCIAKQALLQPTTLSPLLTSSADGQQTLRSTSHEATPQPTPPPTGFIETVLNWMEGCMLNADELKFLRPLQSLFSHKTDLVLALPKFKNLSKNKG
ncbi:hypothetical protein Leryth_003485 [Lithospermum erythrorhizon]|nr:hypothetical protein Leryth_003485 [Lithospermum erythrorhizon]